MKTVQSINSINEGLRGSCGLFKEISINIFIEAVETVEKNQKIQNVEIDKNKNASGEYKKGLDIWQILDISNYLIGCLVINQLQEMIPICFRNVKYREVSVCV